MSKRSKKIIYVILAIVIIVGILAINILIPAPNPNDNDTNTVKEETDTRDVLYKYNLKILIIANLKVEALL